MSVLYCIFLHWCCGSKIDCPCKPFQSSWTFASKAYLSEAHFGCSTLRQAPGLTHKHYTWLERPATDKHSCLLWTRVKSFLTLVPGIHVIKLFSSLVKDCSICTFNSFLPVLIFAGKPSWRHDIQHNDTQYNDAQQRDIQGNGLICDTQHKWHTALCI